jgi:hypothetical protein
MRHLDERQLQRLMDGELDPDSCAWARAHLEQCSACDKAVQTILATSHVVKSTQPDLAGFRQGPEFWACLSQELPQTQRASWPWIALLPPFLLGAFGTLATLMVWGVHTGLTLQQIGLIGPLGSRMVNRLAGSMQTPMLEDNVFRPLGWSGEQMSQNLVILWDDVNQTTHSGAGVLLALMGCGLLLAAVAVLYSIWVLCWVASSERHVETGRQRSGKVLRKGGN